MNAMRILLAEDDPVYRRMLERLLEEAGYQVSAVSSGRGALEKMRSPDAPPMAILDWHMPGLTGPELIVQLRSQLSEIAPYLILLTARHEPEDIVAGLEAGADDYVAKPFHKAELLARLKAGRRLIEAQQQLVESRRLLAWQADHDPLTGILNRRAILERLHEEWARSRREDGCIAVGLADLDGFKQINDAFGHQAGDEALVAVVCRLQECLRPYDALGRLGGDELLIVAPLHDVSPAEGLFRRLCSAVNDGARPLTVAPGARLTISLGWATTEEAESLEQLLALADSALYAAKTRGRARDFPARLLAAG